MPLYPVAKRWKKEGSHDLAPKRSRLLNTGNYEGPWRLEKAAYMANQPYVQVHKALYESSCCFPHSCLPSVQKPSIASGGCGMGRAA